MRGVCKAFGHTCALGVDARGAHRNGVRAMAVVVSVPVLVWLTMLVPAAGLLQPTVCGRCLDTVGANSQAAALSALPQLRVIFICHLVSALTSVLCGFNLVGFNGKGRVTPGQDLALNSLAAVILGGVNFGNGTVGMAGTAVAALMVTILFNLLTSLGLGEPGCLALQGALHDRRTHAGRR